MIVRSRGAMDRPALGALSTLVVVASFVPPPARADLPQIVKEAMEADLNALPGNRFDLSLSFPACGAANPDCLDSLAVELEGLGFAFCLPEDPWVAPDPSPDPGTTVYGCVNAAGATAATLLGGSRLGFQVDVETFYVDFATRRAASGECPGDPGTGTIEGEGFFAAAASIAGEAEIVQVGGCTRLAPDVGTLLVDLEPLALELRADTCLAPAFADSAFRARFLARLEGPLTAALEALFLERMEPVNDAVCALTPVAPGSWGRVKSRHGGR